MRRPALAARTPVTIALGTAALCLAVVGQPIALAADPVPSAGTRPITVVQNELDPAVSEVVAAALGTAAAEINAPGVVVGIDTPDGRWIAVSGTQDWGTNGRDGTLPMTADIHQRIGSITKTYTITALLQLVEQGLISLDDPIGQYLTGIPNEDATLAQLAAMRSGIPSYTFDPDFQRIVFTENDHEWAPEDMIAYIRDLPADFAPGEQTAYSNTNTVLLGMVIEQVTGRPLADVVHDGVLAPLGLDDTITPSDATFPGPHPQGYTVQGQDDGVPAAATDWNPSWGWATGSMIATLDDLLVFGRELVAGETLLSPEMQAARLDSFDLSIPPNTEARAYGLGLGLSNGWYGHTGELPGYNTVMQHHLAEGVTLIVMANSDIKAGDCPPDAGDLPGGPRVGRCSDPAVHVAEVISAALGLPYGGG